MTKRRKTQGGAGGGGGGSGSGSGNGGGGGLGGQQQQQPDDDYIPLPIQTFLWRQTSPFVRPFNVGKARNNAQNEQRDACLSFDRIIIRNMLQGQSPSLSDAIASIDRWRLIKVSFPFVLQCNAALLNNKLIKDHSLQKFDANMNKMMYTLQWILMSASDECHQDSENEAKAKASSLALAAATAATLLKSTAAPVAAGADRQRQGSASSCAQQQQSVVVNSATASAVAVAVAPAVGSHLQMQATLPSSSSVSPIGSSTPTKPLTPTNGTSEEAGANLFASLSGKQQQQQQPQSSYLLPISSIQMFVHYFAPIMDNLKHSDFLAQNQRLETGRDLWMPLFDHQLPNIKCLSAQVKRPSSQSASSQVGHRAQCQSTAASAAAAAAAAGAGHHQHPHQVSFFPTRTGTVSSGGGGLVSDSRRGSSMLQEQAQFGDVFLGGPPTTTIGSTDRNAMKRTDLIDHQQFHHTRKHATTNYLSITSQQQFDADQAPSLDTSYATYLDIAVLRCLFIQDWQESGVYWAISYLANRMAEFCYLDNESESPLTTRPKSISLSHLDDHTLEASVALMETQNLINDQQSYTISKLYGQNDQGTRGQTRDNFKSKSSALSDKSSKYSKEQSQQQHQQQQQQQQQQQASRFLRVEDAPDNPEATDSTLSSNMKSPMRRLSFSSGMQTLANQIRKTSKRVKKSSDGQHMSESVTSESQLSINKGSSMDGKQPPSSPMSKHRRSSSAEDLSLSQILALSTLHKESSQEQTSCKDKHFTGSNPVITVTANIQQTIDSSSTQKKSPMHKKLEQQQRQPEVHTNKQQQNMEKSEHQRLMQQLYSKSLKNLDRLTRSQTVPKDLCYSPFETKKDHADKSDSIGAAYYVDNLGRIDPIVVLKVIHSISQRDNSCSQRVCDKILSLAIKLMNLGILNENFNCNSKRAEQQKDLTNLLPTRQHQLFTLLNNIPYVLNMDSDQQLSRQQQLEDSKQKANLIHKILIDILFHLYFHLGCPNHCGMESTIDHHHQGHQQKLSSINGKASLNLSGSDSHSGKSLRSKLRETLEYLANFNKQNFISYVQSIANERVLQQVVDILHSILGFCHKTMNVPIDHHHSSNQGGGGGGGSTTQAHSNQSVQFMPTPSASGTNLNECSQSINAHKISGSLSSPRSDISAPGETNRQMGHNRFFASSSTSCCPTLMAKKSGTGESVESIIVYNSFKQLITRMANVNKELKLQENTSLYCDIRRLIDYIRHNYNSVFRSIVLSALIDCAKMINLQQKLIEASENEVPTQKGKVGTFTRQTSEDDFSSQAQGGNLVVSMTSKKTKKLNSEVNEEKDNESQRICVDNNNFSSSSSAIQQSPLAQNQNVSPQIQHRTSFGSYRYYPPGHPKHNKHLPPLQTLNQQDQQHSQSTGILSLSKAKKKLEQVFGGKQMGKVKLGSGQPGDDFVHSGSIGPGMDGAEHAVYTTSCIDEASRRASIIGHQSVGSFHDNIPRWMGQPGGNIPHNLSSGLQLANIQLMWHNQQMYGAVRSGMSNFSFLMESCSPGDFLDPFLLAALLDLKSPIAIRAAIYLECANFVHRCNRGHWPSWMRINVGMHRSSNAGVMSSSAASKFRKSSSIQRTTRSNTQMYRSAGRAFYSWAEAVGARLEELLLIEQESAKASNLEDKDGDEAQMLSSEQAATQQTNSTANNSQINSEVDFFQPTLGTSSSPFSLKMAACQLLFEVTTFLRETYRYLPPSILPHQASGSKMGDKMTSIYDVSRAVTANRRWSMALSSLGFGQLPASLNAISASAANQQQGSTSGAISTAGSGGSHLRNPTTTAISEHPERRISFILHETNDENEHQDHQKPDSSSTHADANSTNTITSPLAPSINSNEQQQDALRKMTQGRHLSQSSASSAVVVAAATCLLRSSGVIDSQAHRRKSIKLRKSPQEKDKGDKRAKFAQDLDEEVENSSVSDAGVRRTDSLRSRRRVSGISEKSDTSDRAINGLQQSGQEVGGSGQIGQGDLSGDESVGNGSCEDTYAANETVEADETRIMSNMPWFKAIALINSSIDCECTHFPSCKSNCYKVHQNMCKRLVSCVQSIYQDSNSEQNYATSIFESRLANLINLGNQQRASSQESKSFAATGAGSDCSGNIVYNNNDNESKRKDKKSKKHHQQLDSPRDEFSPVSPKSKKTQEKSGGKMYAMKGFHLDSVASGNGMSSTLMTDAVKALTAAKAKKRATAQRTQEEPQIIKYMRSNVKSLLHCPMSSFLKGAVILQRDNFSELIRFSWNILLEDDQQLSRTAAVGFIISSIKCPSEASKVLMDELESNDASRKIAAINKFHVIWDARYQCWPRLEDGAFVHFKMAPPSIEFTLPSPKIAQESKPVVDPPWMPRKTSNVEEVTIGQDQTVQRSFVTATKTRRKQQIEIVTRALREKFDKLREDRENYHITSVPISLYAAYEPTLSNQAGGDEMDGGGASAEDETQQENRALLQMKTAQALFPTCLCQAAITMINLLDDSRVTYEGAAVYEVANKVIWSCLVEDPALFLRHFFERLTRQNQSTIFQVLRRLIRFMPRLPPQAAYTLYNYLIGFIIYYIRCPVEYSQKLIADTLSVLCLSVPSVYGLFLKDLKQILRKEQCDHNLLITANVPSAKKIIVHGSDSSGIPSQFPIDESTQFYHILVDSLEFFGIEREKQNEYFLIDCRTSHMHNLHSYVRDYYSFKRSQHPQLQLINMDSSKAFDILQKQELVNQFLEFGKVSMSLSIVKSSHMAVQRVLFLHEELMKLPTFPRKALETNFSLFRGPIGHQVFSMDRIHKICWVRVIARMFELTSGFFLQLGDIHLFLNAISGIFVLHCEEASVSRLCLATFINATYQFKNIFATDGFMPIMATIVQVYSNHQNNQLLCRSIEFVCKQFYIMHRKPFLLQLFGSVASRLNTAEIMQQNQSNYPLSMSQPSSSGDQGPTKLMLDDPNRISPTAFFRLLQSLEKAFKDPLDILELVDAEKPLRAVDFCYQQDKEAIEILDIISLCVTVTAYASDSPRSTQMLIILETVVPLYMKYLQATTSKKAGQSMGKQAHKDELQKIQSISICIRTLIVNCEGLTRNFNGPLPAIDLRGSSIRRTGAAKGPQSSTKSQIDSAGSPIDMYNDEASYSGVGGDKGRRGDQNHQGKAGTSYKSAKRYSSDESEIFRGEFIVPRDTLLNLVAEFLSLSTGRLMESAKKYVDLHQKHSSYELLDVKSHLRLAEVANSLLKFASTDPTVMACRGLTRYMNEILPNTEWRQEAIRPALIMILKRLDKTFNRIAKKTWVKRSTDWEGAKQLLKGAYLTFIKHPYIVHLPHLKSLISCCQNIILSDGLQVLGPSSSSNLFHGFNSALQPGIAISQSASAVLSQQQQQQQQPSSSTEPKQLGSNLLKVTSSYYAPGASLSPSGSCNPHASSAPSTSYSNQPIPSLSAVSVAAALAERLANASSNNNNSNTSQGFNSVTIRLIAMQLLQTGDSQSLESFIGNSMNTPEKLESLMLNLIYPMCIRVCSGAREAPKLRVCDIMFILNIVLNMLAPQSSSSKSCSSTSNSPKTATDTSQFILSKITTTIGSTQTGATALGIVSGTTSHPTTTAHPPSPHQDSLKIGFLGLKILCVCFESQLASEWIRISRVIRDLALQHGQPSGPLWDFLDFVATYRFPIFILLLPIIKCQIANKVKIEKTKETAAHYDQCQRLIEAKLHGAAPTICRSKSFLFVSLTAELRMLKEQLIAKRRMAVEGERQANFGTQQQSQGGPTGGAGSLSPSAALQSGESSQQGDHFTAYHRLSAAIASFANQGNQSRPGTSGQNTTALGTSSALKGTCFAAQLATSAPIGPQMVDSSSLANKNPAESSRNDVSQNSIKLSTAKSREEARKVMNTILRRTSYPHNQTLLTSEQQQQSIQAGGERKNSQPPSPSSSSAQRSGTIDVESGRSNQIIMDPAMLMAAFPAPRKNVEGSGILKQLIQTIDRQNQKQQKHPYQTTELTKPTISEPLSSSKTSSSQQQTFSTSREGITVPKSSQIGFIDGANPSHRHDSKPGSSRESTKKSETISIKEDHLNKDEQKQKSFNRMV